MQITMFDYERVREDNIKRNKRFLHDIGLSATNDQIIQRRRLNAEGKSFNQNQRAKNDTSIQELTPVAARRSQRISKSSEEINLPEKDCLVANSINTTNFRRRAAISSKEHAPTAKRVPPSKIGSCGKSCREIYANIDWFRSEGVLGFPMDGYGKSVVMAAANNGVAPKFNKYQGVSEWKNSLFVWINIAPFDNDYPNEFSNDGQYITWFGGSKMKPDSTIIQRLIKCRGSDSNVSTSTSTDTVLLFVRVPGGNYISLGRVVCASANLLSCPAKISWKLDDFHNLINSSETNETFQNILKASQV